MRRHLSMLVVFLAGCTFTLALLTRCAIPHADAEGSGSTDAGSSSKDGGSSSNNGTTVDVPQKSGSRLKTQIFETPDGATDFLGWYDSQLDIPCLRMLASDGKQRCLPSQSNVSFTSYEYFTDAQCTKAAYGLWRKECGSPDYLTVTSNNSTGVCAPGTTGAFKTTVFRISSYTGQRYMKGSDGSCTAVTSNNGTYVSVLEEVPPSEFVEFAVK